MRTNNTALNACYDEEVPLAIASSATGRFSPRTILIIEDDLILSQTIKKFVEDYFDTVLVFECSEKASNYLKNTKTKVNLAFIDYFLPGKNGAEFTIGCSNLSTNMKLYLMSGDLENIKNDSNLNKFDEILSKPLSLSKIKEIILKAQV